MGPSGIPNDKTAIYSFVRAYRRLLSVARFGLLSPFVKMSVSEIVGYLKGKSSLIIFDRHANLKYKYGNRHFWCRGYYVDTVGKNAKRIQEYIRRQLQEDATADQISMKEYIDPFTGKPTNKGK